MASDHSMEEKEVVLDRMCRDLASDPEVTGVFVFGSHARGDCRPDSDIDLLVVACGPFRREILERDGVEFELFFNNEKHIVEFWEANADDFENFWADAKILFDRDGATERLWAAAERIKRMPDRPRKFVFLARQEALRMGDDYIGPEHILLGLVREDSGGGASVLQACGIASEELVREVETIVGEGGASVVQGQLPFTTAAKRILEYSLDEATRLGHVPMGTEHLLLGLLREEDQIAARVLRELGLTLAEARLKAVTILQAEE